MLDCLFHTGACLLITFHQLDQGWETHSSLSHMRAHSSWGACAVQALAGLGATGCKPAALPPWWAAVQARCRQGQTWNKEWKGTVLQLLAGTWPFHTVAGTSESQKGVICCLKSGRSTVKLLLAGCAVCEFSSSPCVSKVLLLPTQL